MRPSRTNLVVVLIVTAGVAIGGLLTFGPRLLRSPADDTAEQMTADAQTGVRPVVIDSVVVEGNIRQADSTIIAMGGLDQGSAYTVSDIRRATRSMWATGQFKDIRVRVEGDVGDGPVTLIWEVDEQERGDVIGQAEVSLEFKLVLSVTELESTLSRIDRQIVGALGVDSIRALGRDVEDPTRDTQNRLFGGDIDQSLNLRPFTSLLSSGDVQGAYLVPTEDVEVATLFLGLTEVQRVLPRNVALHWEAVPIPLGQRTYRRLYVTEKDAFVTGDMLEGATAQRGPFNQPQVAFRLNRAGGRRFSNFTTQHVGDYIAIVLDDEILSAPVVQDRVGASGVINMGDADMVEANDLARALRITGGVSR